MSFGHFHSLLHILLRATRVVLVVDSSFVSFALMGSSAAQRCVFLNAISSDWQARALTWIPLLYNRMGRTFFFFEGRDEIFFSSPHPKLWRVGRDNCRSRMNRFGRNESFVNKLRGAYWGEINEPAIQWRSVVWHQSDDSFVVVYFASRVIAVSIDSEHLQPVPSELARRSEAEWRKPPIIIHQPSIPLQSFDTNKFRPLFVEFHAPRHSVQSMAKWHQTRKRERSSGLYRRDKICRANPSESREEFLFTSLAQELLFFAIL